MREPELDPAAKLRLAFELADAGIAIQRQAFRLADPSSSEEEVDRRLAAWLTHRPGAESGDGEGLRERCLEP